MNRFARLLLDSNMDFGVFTLWTDSLSAFLRHSGTPANTEGVVLGSIKEDQKLSCDDRKSIRNIVIIDALRGPIQVNYGLSQGI